MPASYLYPQYSGSWSLSSQANAKALGTWPTAYNNTAALYSWGGNPAGQLGLGNVTNYSSPKQIGSASIWQTIVAAGASAVFAIKSNGTLWAWGSNVVGQLGLSNTTNYSSPKQVGALTTWSSIASGYAHALAIKTDGTLWAWGSGSTGGLGNGGVANASSPVQIGALTTWLQVSAGYNSSSAIKTDGTLWVWGRNALGQLGKGNTTNYSSPIQLGALTTWAKVSMGFQHCVATKTDGTIWAWGGGAQGALGLGNTTYYSSPKQIGALTTWTTPTAGLYASFGIKSTGALWSWGRNDVGQLGLGTSSGSYTNLSPLQVGALTTWKTVSQGVYSYSTVAVKTDGTLWSWGSNTNGTLGLGNTTPYSSPKQVGSLTIWASAVTNGLDNATLAITSS